MSQMRTAKWTPASAQPLTSPNTRATSRCAANWPSARSSTPTGQCCPPPPCSAAQGLPTPVSEPPCQGARSVPGAAPGLCVLFSFRQLGEGLCALVPDLGTGGLGLNRAGVTCPAELLGCQALILVLLGLLDGTACPRTYAGHGLYSVKNLAPTASTLCARGRVGDGAAQGVAPQVLPVLGAGCSHQRPVTGSSRGCRQGWNQSPGHFLQG